MKRIEIIISRALDEEFLERLEANEVTHFTAISPVMGQGFSNPKLGNAPSQAYQILLQATSLLRSCCHRRCRRCRWD